MKIIKSGFYVLPKTKETLKAVIKYSYKQGNDFDYKVITSAKISKDTIKFPRNLKKLSSLFNIDNIDDITIAPKLDNFQVSENLQLRDYQVKPVNDVITTLQEKQTAVLNAKTSFGKSYVIPYIVSKMNTKTLICVDRSHLVKQMEDEFKTNSNNNVSVLSTKNKEIKDVNITTFQFLHKNPDLVKKLAKNIGFLIIDEAHILGAETYRDVMSKLNHKYQLGLTATFSRSDGLTNILYDLFGENIIIGNAPVEKIDIKLIDTGWYCRWDGKSWSEAYTKICNNDGFSDLVCKTILSYKKQNRRILLYASYKSIFEFYKFKLENLDIKVEIISGTTPKKQRELYIQQLQNNEIDVLISGVILNKGVSIHKLDTIINLATHNKESLEQLLGRLRRSHKEKQTPIYVDFLHSGVLRKQTSERVKMIQTISKNYDDKITKYSLSSFKKYLEVL